MYCGSCLRDNAMATELIARGHDVMLLPVYTPTFTSSPQQSVIGTSITVPLSDHVAVLKVSA